MEHNAFREEISAGIRSFLNGRRIALDVSVLLSGILDEQSPSAWILRCATHATVVLPSHTEDMAIKVLRWNAPSLVPVFGAGLVKLATRCTIERIRSIDPATLGDVGERLDQEDRQVLADAIPSASVLYTHDSEFFRQRIPGLIVIAPGAQAWDPFPASGLRAEREWTFLGWFLPSWNTKAVRGTTERFFIFEIADHIACFYQAKTAAFVLEWWAKTPKVKSLELRHNVEATVQNFVAVIAEPTSITMFVNGETRRAEVDIGRAPLMTTFHPFNSAKGTGQIFGTCQFRFVENSLTERAIRRHWRTRSLQLTDGEIQWTDAVRRFSTFSPTSRA